MQSQDVKVLQRADRWLDGGRAVVLVTVVQTWGSSPRPPGALMALCDDGRIAGSVSGGCIEDDLLARIRSQGIPALPQRLSYGEDADEARRFGLPCGGSMQLVLEPLRGADALSGLLGRLAAGERVARHLDLDSGEVSLAVADRDHRPEIDDRRFTAVFGPQYRLLIIGAGQIAELLAPVARALDFAVSLCDPRGEYRTAWAVDGLEPLDVMPDEAVSAMDPDSNTAVVALTHDPKLDDMALIEALASEAFYVAALGSRGNNDRRRERLRQFDLTEAQIARLQGPAGLAIGSKTPAEIAVSIAAQLVATKNGISEIPI